MMDFWQWAFGDLRANNVRGVFAEWMVAQLLGLEPNPRGAWDDYDILLPDGRTVEVKASAYHQVWHIAESTPSVIQFTGLKGQRWNVETQSRSSPQRTYNADLYVFCVQTEKDPSRWDGFDLAQWEFYVVPRARLEAHGRSSVRLSVVQSFTTKVSAAELPAALGVVGPSTAAGPNGSR
jgi:hypothetical protein